MRAIAIILLCALVSGCTISIADLKQERYVGEKVTAVGVVTSSVKIGSLSGFILEDKTGTISVRSDELPSEGEKVTVSGTLMKDTLFGYYILARSVG